MLHNKDSRGFTIIELMFAMTFLTILLIILLVSVIQITRTYNKGVTLKRVNQSGRSIGQEVQQAIQQAGDTSVYNGKGRLCLGNYSFVWSQPKTSINGHIVNEIDNEYDDGNPVGFAKVNDGKLCDAAYENSQIIKSQATELLGDGLVMRQPTELVADQSSNRLLTFKYTISTPDDGSGVFSFLSPTQDELQCTGSSGNEFCALSTFIVTAYAKGL